MDANGRELEEPRFRTPLDEPKHGSSPLPFALIRVHSRLKLLRLCNPAIPIAPALG